MLLRLVIYCTCVFLSLTGVWLTFELLTAWQSGIERAASAKFAPDAGDGMEMWERVAAQSSSQVLGADVLRLSELIIDTWIDQLWYNTVCQVQSGDADARGFPDALTVVTDETLLRLLGATRRANFSECAVRIVSAAARHLSEAHAARAEAARLAPDVFADAANDERAAERAALIGKALLQRGAGRLHAAAADGRSSATKFLRRVSWLLLANFAPQRIRDSRLGTLFLTEILVLSLRPLLNVLTPSMLNHAMLPSPAPADGVGDVAEGGAADAAAAAAAAPSGAADASAAVCAAAGGASADASARANREPTAALAARSSALRSTAVQRVDAAAAEEKRRAPRGGGAEAEVVPSGDDAPSSATVDALPSAEEVEALVASVRSATHAIVEASVLNPEKPVAARLQRSFVAALESVLSAAFVAECRAADAVAEASASASAAEAGKGAAVGGDRAVLAEAEAPAHDDASWLMQALRQKRVVSAFECVALRVRARGDAAERTRLHHLVTSTAWEELTTLAESLQWLNFGDVGDGTSSGGGSSSGGGGTAAEIGEEDNASAGLAALAAPTARGKAERDAAPSRPLLANAAWTSVRRRARWLSGSVDSYHYGGGKDGESTFVRFRIRCCIAQSDSDAGGAGGGVDVWEVDRRFSEFDKVHACVADSFFVVPPRVPFPPVSLTALRALAPSPGVLISILLFSFPASQTRYRRILDYRRYLKEKLGARLRVRMPSKNRFQQLVPFQRLSPKVLRKRQLELDLFIKVRSARAPRRVRVKSALRRAPSPRALIFAHLKFLLSRVSVLSLFSFLALALSLAFSPSYCSRTRARLLPPTSPSRTSSTSPS